MKRRVVIVFLVAFTLWPLAHRVMVAAFNTNPWKFYGWAMYCVPNPKTFIQVVAIKGKKAGPLAGVKADGLDLSVYRYRRSMLGALAPSPDELARAILLRHPEVDGIGVLIRQYHLDWRTALLKWETEGTIQRRQ